MHKNKFYTLYFKIYDKDCCLDTFMSSVHARTRTIKSRIEPIAEVL